MRSVLFVCTGNIFRSLTAEHALRREVGGAVHVASAGTADMPDLTVRADVAAYLAGHGLDVSGHQRRTLQRSMLDTADLVIAMNTDHQADLRDRFGHRAPLFTEAAGGGGDPLPDVNDLFAPGDYFTPEAVTHVKAIIDRIIAETPALAGRLGVDL